MGRDGRGLGGHPGDRPGPGVSDGPPVAAHGARGSRSLGLEPSGGQPGPCRGRVLGDRRARRGPAGAAYLAVGDHWQWFGRVVAERKVREGDPIIGVLEAKEREAASALEANPDDRELAALRDWLSAFLVFVRLFDRAVGLVPQLDPRELERSISLLGRIPDTTILRLFDLLGGLPDQDVIELVEALSRLSPTAARRATKLMSGVIRTVSR